MPNPQALRYDGSHQRYTPHRNHLRGQRDKIAPVVLAEELRAGIPGARLDIFPGGHLRFLRKRQRFLGAVYAFLDA